MDTYAARRAVRRTTGHYRRPGTDRSYCGLDLDHTPTPADTFRAICQKCSKAEARDRAEAEAVADDHREGAAEQALAQSLTPKMRKVLPAVVAAGDFRDAGLANLPEGVTDPSLQALIRRGLAERYDSGETFVGFSGRTYKVMRYRATDLGRAVAAVLTGEQAEVPAVQAAPVATNAFEQGAAGLLDAPRPGRYTLRVCEDPRDVCDRGLCRTTSTRAAGTLDEVRAAAAMFRHAWPANEQGNPVEDDDQAAAREQAETLSLDALADTVTCPTCHVAAGARCVTRAGKPAREPHGRRFEALEQAAGITEHRAAARREAEARGGWVAALDRKAEDALLTAYAARLNARALVDDDQAVAADAPEAEPTAEEQAASLSVRRYIAREFPAVADLLGIDSAADDAEAEQFARAARAVDAVEHAEQVEARVDTVEDAEALYAAALVTEAEATEGTWQGAWIGEQPAGEALFDLDQDVEQGALFRP